MTMDLPSAIELKPCDVGADGPFIRDLTRSNFFDVMSRTEGWNEERHQQQPSPPESYQVVYRHGERIGFLSLRDDPGFLYLVTIQLSPDARGHGVGTTLMYYVEHCARDRECGRVRLRVFKDNRRAMALYDRLGYVVVESDQFSHLMEKQVPGAPSHST